MLLTSAPARPATAPPRRKRLKSGRPVAASDMNYPNARPHRLILTQMLDNVNLRCRHAFRRRTWSGASAALANLLDQAIPHDPHARDLAQRTVGDEEHFIGGPFCGGLAEPAAQVERDEPVVFDAGLRNQRHADA